MENHEIIRLLNVDLQKEHAAIIQYLQHAYILGEGSLRTEIEAIAREEMYHFQWLAEAIATLTGDPSTARDRVILEAASPGLLMEINVQTEQGAIDSYEEHLKQIRQPEIRALLERILQDEHEHQGAFRNFQTLLADAPFPALEKKETPLLEVAKQEYSTTVQYLFQSFTAPSCDLRRRMSDLSIVTMKHLGWVSERLVDLGWLPDPELLSIDHAQDRSTLLEANQKRLQALEKTCEEAKNSADPATQHLLERIVGNHRYQRYAFEHGPEFPTAPSAWTVGPLKR